MIRFAAWEDLEQVYTLLCILEETSLPREAFDNIYRVLLDSRDHILLVHDTAGAADGFLHLRTEKQLHHAALVAEILELVVSPERRGCGVGSALMEEARRLAAAQGCILLEVASTANRESAHRFYLRSGLERTHFRFSTPL